MRVKNISYENLNGLTNGFEFSDKLNIFVGSNGKGKTTSLDCLAILLFGESFSYNKSLEKHIDVKNKDKVCTLNMIVETDAKIIDENNVSKNIDVEFAIKMFIDNKGKFTRQWFINGGKITKDKYEEKICSLFKIPNELLKIEKINLLRCLIDPTEINNSDNQSIYNLVRALTNVMSLEYFVNNNDDYAILRQSLAINDYDFKLTSSKIKNDIKSYENHLGYIDEKINESEKEINILKEKLDFEKYNANVDEYNNIKKEIDKESVEVAILKDELSASKVNDESNRLNKINQTQKQYYDLLDQKNTAHNECKFKAKEIDNLNHNIFQIEQDINNINNNINNILGERFEEIICQSCGKVANAKDKESFEKQKEEKIAKYKEQIVELEKQKELIKANINDSTKFLVEILEKKFEELEEKVQSSFEEYNNALNIVVVLSDKTKDISKRIEEKELQIYELKTKLNSELKTELENFNSVYNKYNYIINNTIEPAKKDKERILNVKANDELKLNVLNEMNIEYIKLVEQAITDTFGDVKFNMIKEGKTSGKEKMSCYAIQDEKPIYNYNTASEIALGCKIIQLIKNKLGVKGLPILFDIVDNIGEKSLNDIIKYCDSQLFCTKALFEENKELKLISDIKEIK